MADVLAPVLIPYDRFLECRERRLGHGSERTLIRHDGPSTVDGAPLLTTVPNDERESDAARFPQTHSVTGVQKP